MRNGEFSSPDRKSSMGCGLFSAVFGRRKLKPRRSASTGNFQTQANGNNTMNIIFTTTRKTPSHSKRRRGGLDDDDHVVISQPQPQPQPQPSPRNQTSSSMVAVNTKMVPKESQPQGISGELESLIAEQQRNRGGSNLVRVSSSNAMVHRNLGNLRQLGGTTYTYAKPNANAKDNTNTNTNTNNNDNQYHNQNHQPSPNRNTNYSTMGMGNIVMNNKKQSEKGSALSCRMDPEELKILGNEDYKNGRFAEALALYERAVDLDPSKASYRTNKSAALSALGRLLEAVFECTEALRIHPHYQRTHHRLAILYLRLGEAEKALYHFIQAGPEPDPDEISKTKTMAGHLKKCDEAKRYKDWHTLLKESSNAITSGADSAPLIFGLQAEAYLKLHRYQEAETSLTNSPNIGVDQCTKFFGPPATTSLLVIKAQVDMAFGRFDEALEAAQDAGRLDPSNREVSMVARRARAVSLARSRGNDLFKDSRFSEACIAYGEGLEHDPYNSVLFCNRAACRIKLSQFEKAIDDSTAALNVRPSYTKARVRRADSNVKLQKWEVAIRDYEILLQESPGDEGVCRSLFEALLQLKKQRGEDVSNMRFANDGVIRVQSEEQLRSLTTWPGLLVALFSTAPGSKQTIPFMEELCKRYPTVKFINVEAEDNQWILKSENANSLPVFQIYKTGSSLKQVPGEDHQALESSIKQFIS